MKQSCFPDRSRFETRGRVLVVDDDPITLNAYCYFLQSRGYAVEGAQGPMEALALVGQKDYDVVLSDVQMPDGGGIELLRSSKAIGARIPTVLTTGFPSVETATAAVEEGVVRYLAKPVPLDTLERAIEEGVELRKESRRRAQAQAVLDRVQEESRTRAGLGEALDSAIAALYLEFQPIASLRRRKAVAFEVLVRSTGPALKNPKAIFSAAEILGRVEGLGRAIRDAAGAVIAARQETFFVNVHPLELNDEALYDPNAPLSRVADRVFLEITERAALEEVLQVKSRVQKLRQLGFRIAIDDLGCGHAGLASIVQLEPDVVKLDMELIRDIDKEPTKQKLIGSIVQLAKDLGCALVAEGIETPAELETLVRLRCDLLQGYLFARPAPIPPAIDWPTPVRIEALGH